jgi:hypothetical protein
MSSKQASALKRPAADESLPEAKSAFDPSTLADSDICWGSEEIGRVIRRSSEQVRHLIEQKKLPMVRRLGHRTLIARVGDLRKLADIS